MLKTPVTIEVLNRQRLVPIARHDIAEVAAAVLVIAGPSVGIGPGAGIAMAFVRDRAIRKLNSEFRGKDQQTDVLSFPAADRYDPASDTYLGDVVISTDTALSQACEGGHSIEREINELVIHGVLHLCGYDHEVDQGQMNRLERKLRRKLLDQQNWRSV
jgi:probable rRNA maturation factor